LDRLLVRDDDTGIYYRFWKPARPRAVLLLVHGMGAHTGRWEFLANYFTGAGFSVYAIELSGFGQTSGDKGHIDSFRQYYNDIINLQIIAKDENPGKRIFILGESLGGLISLLLVSEREDLFSGIICISPALKSILKLSPMIYLKILVSFFIFPRKRFVLPFNASMCTRDGEYIKVMDNDQREHRFATARLLGLTLLAQMRILFSAEKINIPVLFLVAGNDMLVDTQAIEGFYKRLTGSGKDIIRYAGMRHALSIDVERDKVFEDILHWLMKRL